MFLNWSNFKISTMQKHVFRDKETYVLGMHYMYYETQKVICEMCQSNITLKSLFLLNLILPFSSHWNFESYLSTKASILTFRACMSVHFTLHYNFLWPPIKVSIGLWIQAMMCGFQLECIPISAVIWYTRGRYSYLISQGQILFWIQVFYPL